MKHLQKYENFNIDMNSINNVNDQIKSLEKKFKDDAEIQIKNFLKYYNINKFYIGFHEHIWEANFKIYTVFLKNNELILDGYVVDYINKYDVLILNTALIDTIKSILELINEIEIEDIIFSTARLDIDKAKELLDKHNFDYSSEIIHEREMYIINDEDLYLSCDKNLEYIKSEYNILKIPKFQKGILEEYGKDALWLFIDNEIEVDSEVKKEFEYLFDSNEIGLL